LRERHAAAYAVIETPTMANDTLPIGSPAPDFELPTQDGKTVRLSDFRGKKAVVLYFYPKDHSQGCTTESCSFRDAYEDFVKAGAEVIGVSSDGVDSHRRFASDHHLPFILASDAGGKVRARYGVKATMWIIPGRETFVIDRDGIVRHTFSSQAQVTRHVEESLEMIKAFAAMRPAGGAT
jgi:peroxiredoxin Q/BCP